jgi:hypothetical protein
MQQSLRRSDASFAEHLSDIPSRLPESLTALQNSLSSIQSEFDQNRFQKLRSRVADMSDEISKLRSHFTAHTNFTDDQLRQNAFRSVIPELQQRLMSQNQLLLDESEHSLAQKLDHAALEADSHSSEQPSRVCIAPIASNRRPGIGARGPARHLVEQLEKYHDRIPDLELKFEIAKGRIPRIEEFSALLGRTRKNQERLQQIRIKSELVAARLARPLPPPGEE